MITGEFPQCEESSLQDLKQFIEEFPYPIREVQLTGGSPELHPDFVEFTNWLLNKGYFVQIMTNLLLLGKLIRLKRSDRLMLCSTYHHSSDLEVWMNNYDYLSKHYRTVTDEIQRRLTLKRVKIKHIKRLITMEELKDKLPIIRIAPNLQMYNNCYNLLTQSNRIVNIIDKTEVNKLKITRIVE